MFHEDPFKTRSDGYVTALAILEGESTESSSPAAGGDRCDNHPQLPGLVSQTRCSEDLRWRAKSERYQGVTLSICMKIGGVGLLKELNSKSISKNKLQNRNVFYYEILVTGSPLSSFQTSAHLPPLHSRVSLGLPAVLSELLTLIWRAPVVMLTFVPRSPLRGSSLLRSRPFSLPPACTAFLHRER